MCPSNATSPTHQLLLHHAAHFGADATLRCCLHYNRLLKYTQTLCITHLQHHVCTGHDSGQYHLPGCMYFGCYISITLIRLGADNLPQ
jgi:hypothetical protein